MPNVKTTTLSGTETKVTLPQNYPFCFITNMSESEIYASGNPGIVPYADGVYTIPAGTEIRISPEASGDTLWLLGSGKVQIRGEEIAAPTSFKLREKGGDSGFSGDYNDLTSKPDIPVPSNVIDSNSTNETVSTSKAVFDYVISTLASAGFKPVKVTELPEVGSDRVLYLLPKDDLLSGNLYNEYLWIDGTYELVGSTAVDLSDYATIEQLNGKQDILAKSTLRDDSVDWDTLSETSIHSIEAFNKLSDNYTHGLEGVYGYGILIIAAAKINVCYQIYFNARCEIYIRSKHNLWDNWKRIDAAYYGRGACPYR